MPVRDSRGETIAAMPVSAMAGRVPLDRPHRGFLPVLRDQAGRLGRIR